ncbi:type VI secretion system-associated FHA domain protein TagH [Rahnella woolbedingensis]|uniref:Type VI secretion system-associated FHA domain protein TagH n=1 Tax=Rahnella woolbedingensis TaxID=1510574 RepID=A0A419NDG7_9GAMM|nr:type VI secretion system-associated FHA domain protein TagH [Rahnella woolbedingensis]RJT46515.1 type VI secretion system-associated FHA domain protein TagH [Rahnella woolbedingensis]
MAEDKQQPSLSLQVMNGNELESGRAAKCLFTTEGGEIGHAQTNYWSVQDRQHSIEEKACAVRWHDGTFCLHVFTQNLRINQATVPANSGLIRLRQGDEIFIGSLCMKAQFHLGEATGYDTQNATPETIVMNRDMLTETLLNTDGQPSYHNNAPHREIAPTLVNSFSQDPLAALQKETLTTHHATFSAFDDTSELQYSHRPARVAPGSDHLPKGGIDNNFMDLPEIHTHDDYEPENHDHNMTHRHVAITPLMRGLGHALPLQNSQDADDFLEEIGRTLQAAVRGLLELQFQQNSLSDKHLRPLEDNPLRLSLNYETALNVLFAEQKSPVHLSAPAAVSESLRNIKHHNQANQTAIVEALGMMLDALSPAQLIQRFAQYRRSNEQRQEINDAWAWRMYCNYYEELASSRQLGFEKLFNEVYAQVYDRVLRQASREPNAS